MEVTVQKRGKRGYSLSWVDADGTRHCEMIGHIAPEMAWKMAGRREAEMELDGVGYQRMPWKEFREKIRKIHYPALAKKTRYKYERALDLVEQTIRPTYIDDVTTAGLREFAATVFLKETSIKSNLSSIRAALKWAIDMEMIHRMPKIPMPKLAEDPSKGRPLTDAEVDALIAAVPSVRRRSPEDVPMYQRFIRGISLCGLRLDEARRLEWDSPTGEIVLDTSKERWKIIYRVQKNGKEIPLPVMDDFQAFLESLPGDRRGRVFGVTVDTDCCSRVISRAGKAAKIVVSTHSRRDGKPKYASAHDLRRTFGARWAELLPEVVLAAIMRHSSIETTRKHYAMMDAERLERAITDAIRRRDGKEG